MITWRIIGSNGHIGPWQKDVTWVLRQQIQVWIDRKERFTVEFQ